MELHHNLFDLFRALHSLRSNHKTAVKECKVRDDSMVPTLKKGQAVEVDCHKPAMHGDIVAIVLEEGMEFRELYVCKGVYYLVAHNRAYPKIALRDYRGLNPESYFLGVVR